ncbi:MAG: adenylate/guanylate cyclase domain-containing protein [Verrucomicrobiota bacterium]
MKLKSFKPIPVLIATVTIGLACFFQSDFFTRRSDFFHQLELDTYDKRIQFAKKFPQPAATNLAFIRLDEITLQVLTNVNWPYPRELHGRLVRELSAQGTKAVGFDVMFGELRPYDSPVLMPDQSLVESDEFFAEQMRGAGTVVLASDSKIFPPPLFATNAMAVGDITADSDSDGVLRRAKAFTDDPKRGRRWHMGIILAAKELGLDLNQAEIRPGQIVLRAPHGVQRIIPTDPNHYFLINWRLGWDDRRLAVMPYGGLIELDKIRRNGTPEQYHEAMEIFREISGRTNLASNNPFDGKLVVIGSILVGNNLTDRGPTPINKQDFLVSKHWNVANSVITGQFIRPSPYLVELCILLGLGILSAILTLQLRALSASFAVIGLIAVYIAASFFLFVQYRYWIPIVLPVTAALLATHVCLVTYRVRVEQKERRRVKAVFSKIVSPNVVNELLDTEKLSLRGARRKITVFFADVRGFTEMTDLHQARAEEYVREHDLIGNAAEAHFDKQAHETLDTVNLYLSTIADKVKEHNGTLDKYIGDCVMAFWGAPTANEKHALCCVRAAIDAQRAMHSLNEQRAVENQKREQENLTRSGAGQPPLEILPLLSLGSGINTGTVIVGLMGSDAHILNYTVFGREVNLASRLEGVSGRGRIIIGESTFREIQRDDPQLAATCVELPAVTVKGIKSTVKIYEVTWKTGSETSIETLAETTFSERIKV